MTSFESADMDVVIYGVPTLNVYDNGSGGISSESFVAQTSGKYKSNLNLQF